MVTKLGISPDTGACILSLRVGGEGVQSTRPGVYDAGRPPFAPSHTRAQAPYCECVVEGLLSMNSLVLKFFLIFGKIVHRELTGIHIGCINKHIL